jgi:HlyD family secretion protein
VIAKAKFNSINAPKQVTSRTEGKLISIVVKENETVNDSQVLAYMESIANPKSIIQLHENIDSIQSFINQNKTEEIIKYYPTNSIGSIVPNENELGELQSSYQIYVQAFTVYKDFLRSGFYQRKKEMLFTDMQNLQKMHEMLNSQKELFKKDLLLSDDNFKANESLAREKVISALEYRNEKSKLIAKQLSLPQINANIVMNEAQQNDKRKELADLENQIIVQKSIFLQALETIKSQVLAWEFKYLLKAPIAGMVKMNGFIQEKQEMKIGQIIFYLQPDNSSYYVEMLIPQYNFGKVKIGQKVLLKLQAYPFEQYGSVIGRIENINSTPTDSGFLAKVIIPDGLVTNFKRSIQFRNGLYAEADIITDDMRLLERFYYNFIKQFKR